MSIPKSLSDREKEVAALLMQGRSNKQIAQALGVSTRTVEFHISNIYQKLGVSSRAEAILRMSEPDLRETTGTPARTELRQAPVEMQSGQPENGENKNHSIRRFTMKTAVLAFLAMITLLCLFVVVIGVLNYQNPARPTTGGILTVEGTPIGPTFTPIQPTFTPIQPTYTPIQPTYTPYAETPSAGSIPQVTTEQPLAPLSDGRFSFEGVSFHLGGIGTSASGQVMLENPEMAGGPFWETEPQHVRIGLGDYPVSGSMHAPAINVYPVDEYLRTAPLAGEQIGSLKTLLEHLPADGERMPFLPLVNAGQIYHSNTAYLDFANGSGVRYLALYAQYPAPVNNQDIFYTFQGLTDDGQHYISIVLPVNHPSLRESANDFTQAEMEALIQTADYYTSSADSLSAEPDSSFSPGLDVLDAVVKSVTIDR